MQKLLIKLKQTDPENKYIANVLSSILYIVEKTREITAIVNKGFNNVHKYPNIVLLYLIKIN